MFRKSITLALAAAVSLGAFALSASTASAFHAAGGGGGVHAIGSGGVRAFGSGLHVNSSPMVQGIRIKPQVFGIKINPIFNHHAHWPRWGWYRYTFRHPYWVAPVIAGGVATYAATTPTTSTCTCLTKQYTPEGAVVFKDVCTNEMAMNPPVNASPAADMSPQMPQQPMQQGYLQPQAQ
jgi:hypothetical protein